MTKLLLIVMLFGMAADAIASSNAEPPLLIDSAPAPAPLDGPH